MSERRLRIRSTRQPAVVLLMSGPKRSSAAAAAGAVVVLECTSVVVQPLFCEFDDVCGHAVEEVSVVADEHQCGLDLLQVRLQPADGGEVEMVGWLVLSRTSIHQQQPHEPSSAMRLTQLCCCCAVCLMAVQQCAALDVLHGYE